MKCAKYFSVLIISTFVYVLLSMTVGQNSIYCFKQLETEKAKVSVNTSEIEKLNTELKLEYSAILNDKAVIAAYARKLDYVQPGEKIVKVNGLPPVQSSLYSTGTILKHEEPVFISESICKMISLFSGVFVLVILVLIDISKGNIIFAKPRTVTEIPVYDLPQI